MRARWPLVALGARTLRREPLDDLLAGQLRLLRRLLPSDEPLCRLKKPVFVRLVAVQDRFGEATDKGIDRIMSRLLVY